MKIELTEQDLKLAVELLIADWFGERGLRISEADFIAGRGEGGVRAEVEVERFSTGAIHVPQNTEQGGSEPSV